MALQNSSVEPGNITALQEILNSFSDSGTKFLFSLPPHVSLFKLLIQGVSSPFRKYRKYLTNGKVTPLFNSQILISDDNPLYNTAKNLNILYRNQSSGNIYNGTYLGNSVAFPDFSNSTLAAQFVQSLVDWIDSKLGLEYISGFVLNDNWPQDDSYVNVDKTDFPYYSKVKLNIFQRFFTTTTAF